MSEVSSIPHMSNGEWASWTQVIVASMAVLASGLIAGWQARAQYRVARRVQENDYLQLQKRTASTLVTLAEVSARAMDSVSTSLGTRTQLYEVAELGVFVDMGEIDTLARAFDTIPLHELPSSDLLRQALIAGSLLRQYSQLIERAVRDHRTMDGNAYTTFSNSMIGLTVAMNRTTTDLAEALAALTSVSD